MKRLIIIILLVSGTMQAYAQQGRNRPTPDEKLDRITSRIENQLNLDEEKMDELAKVYAEFFASMEEERTAMRNEMMKKRAILIKERNCQHH